jgi:hypothetical protein
MAGGTAANGAGDCRRVQEAMVSGATQVESLLLRDANGDRTEIGFTDVQYAGSVSASERASVRRQSRKMSSPRIVRLRFQPWLALVAGHAGRVLRARIAAAEY